MLGLKHTTVKLVPHNDQWRYLFQKEVITLRHSLKNPDLRVEHVGSTALPNIVSKPILDMFIPCFDIQDALSLTSTLADIDYELVSDNDRYKLFIKGCEEARTHHLTFTNPNEMYWKETLAFRDYLLEHPAIARRYEQEKLELAELYKNSRRNYSSNKARFIQKVLRELRASNRSKAPNKDTVEPITIHKADLESIKDFKQLGGTFNDNSNQTNDYIL